MVLPATLTRGEILSLQVMVYNYMNVDLKDVSVRLLPTPDFKRVVATTTNNDEKNKQDKLIEVTNESDNIIIIPYIKSQSGESVSFLVTPVKVGLLTISVRGASALAGDTEQRTIRVKAEGVEEIENFGLLVDLRRTNSYKAGFNVKPPEGIIPDSEYCKLQVVGDIFGTSLNNLDKLINRPCGCGEQNMLSLTPNIYALRYMLSASSSSSLFVNRNALIANAKQNILIGYQNELNYMHADGSFSAFGKSDDSGSSWLTAFVLKSFLQAGEFVSIDERVVEKSIDWLLSQQSADGSFAEPGNVIHKDMQGGVNSVNTITAYITIALLESKPKNYRVKNSVSRAVSYLQWKFPEVKTDRYAMGLTTYALYLANNTKADEAFAIFNKFATKTPFGDLFWPTMLSRPVSIFENVDSSNQVQGSDIELTSYALLIYLIRNKVDEALPIVRWLLSESSSLGGYSSTQNTVLALQGLSEYSSKLQLDSQSDPAVDQLAFQLTLNNLTSSRGLQTNDVVSKLFQINDTNKLVLHVWELPSCHFSSIQLQVTGQGLAFFQILLSYNMPKKLEQRRVFTLRQAAQSDGANSLKMKTCLRYNEVDFRTKKRLETGMTLIEADLLSGYAVNQHDINALLATGTPPELKMIEVSKDKDKVVFYLSKMGPEVVCIDWRMDFVYPVGNLQPTVVRAYDYYRPSMEVSIMFAAPKHLLNVCESHSNIC
jgi:CD109 antigen